MAAKVDNATIQDGYSLYHHVILFDQHGDWAIIQHWISDSIKSFVLEPQSGIISECKRPNVLNVTSVDSTDNPRICADLATTNSDSLKSSAFKFLPCIEFVV
jgi:hypothetical protein